MKSESHGVRAATDEAPATRPRRRRTFGPLTRVALATFALAAAVNGLYRSGRLDGIRGSSSYFEMRGLAHRVVDGPAHEEAFSKLLEHGAAAKPWLLWILNQPDPRAKSDALGGLAYVAPTDRDVFDITALYWRDPDPDLACDALYASLRILESAGSKQLGEERIDQMFERLVHLWKRGDRRCGDRLTKSQLVGGLKHFGSRARALVPDIAALLLDPKSAKEGLLSTPESNPRWFTAGSTYIELAAIDPQTAEDVGLALIDWFGSDSRPLRDYAVRVLIQYGYRGDQRFLSAKALERVLEKLHDPRPETQFAACDLLSHDRTLRSELRAAVTRLAANSEAPRELRGRALQYPSAVRYELLKRRGEGILDKLDALPASDRERLLSVWINTSGRDRLVDQLVEIASAADPRVASAACTFLDQIAPKPLSALPALLHIYRDPQSSLYHKSALYHTIVMMSAQASSRIPAPADESAEGEPP